MSSESRAKKRWNCFAHGPKAAINTQCGKELNMNDVTVQSVKNSFSVKRSLLRGAFQDCRKDVVYKIPTRRAEILILILFAIGNHGLRGRILYHSSRRW